MPKKSLDTIVKNDKYVPPKKVEGLKSTFGSQEDFYKEKKVKTKRSKERRGLNRYRRSLYKKIIFWSIPIIILILLWFSPPVQAFYNLAHLYQDGRYLILFQNNSELRGGGGFLGSFAVVDIQDHRLKSYYFEANIYKKDNQFTARTKIPEPVYFQQGFGPNITMALRDANYPSDFATAANNVAHYYDLEYGHQTINGVIGVNASLVADLLKLTGPIKAPNGPIISSSNFFDTVQKEVEGGYFVDQNNISLNEPKSILKDMAPLLLKQTKSVNPIKLYHFFQAQIKTKNILLWFNDERENRVVKNNWGGTIPKNNNDLIFISNNNIGGEKTSLSISQSISLVIPNGNSLSRELTVTRSYDKPATYSVGVDNKNYTKIFLPFGSKIVNVVQDDKILNSKDYILSQEEGKEVVGLWTTTSPNQTKITTLNYSLPIETKTNRINYVIQPGQETEELSVRLGNKIYFNGLVHQDQLFKIHS